MSWAWLALLDLDEEVVGHPRASATAMGPAGRVRLVAWGRGLPPHPRAVQVDDRLLDPGGPARGTVWLWLPPGRAPLFDDPAVQALARRLGGADRAGHRPLAASLAVRDPVHLAGGLTVHAVGEPLGDRLRDSWLRAFGRPLALAVGPGLLAAEPVRPVPVGTQRYGGQPWPVTGFPGARRRTRTAPGG